MAFRNYRQQSRDCNWGTEHGEGLSIEQINCGSMLRLADAAEKMAMNHAALIRERDHFERDKNRYFADLEREKRRTAALRGVIGRMKRQAAK